MLLNILALVLLVGLTAAALLVCLAKWKVLQAWEVKRPTWLPKLCLFCLGFWLSVAQVAAYSIYQHNALFLLAALPAAAVCRFIYADS
jgi:hypothetical protein